MKTLTQLGRSAFLAVLVAGTLAACDSSTSALEQETEEESLELFASELTLELALSGDQQAALGQTMSRFGDGGPAEPGFLWRLAAELAANLTPEQKERLLNRTPRGGQGDGADGRRGGGQGGRQGGGQGGVQGGDQGGRSGGGGFLAGILTEAQIADLEAIREARRAEIEELLTALRAARDAGDSAAVTAAHEAIRAIHEEVRAEIQAYLDANLTADQQAAIDAAQADREAERAARQAAERAVMIEVLGITDAQADEILAAVQAFQEAIQALDRTADNQATVEGLVTDLNAAVATIINDDAAFEIWQIHQALSHRARKHRRGGRGRGGNGRPAGGGTGG